jgi:hypothetical protein
MSIDYLTEDTFLPPEQKFVCLSFLTKKYNNDDETDNSSLVGIKVRGVFDTYDNACKFAKKLQDYDSTFDVYVGDMGKWLPFDPKPDNVKNSEYANEELNNLMKNYLENQEKAKLFHEQRKQELIKQNLIDNLFVNENNLNELNTQKNDCETEEEKLKINDIIKSTEDKIKSLSKEKDELDNQLEILNKKIKLISEKTKGSIKVINV